MAADRTTIQAVLQTLVSRLRSSLVANPPTASKPFRRVEEGPVGAADLDRPFLTVQIAEIEPAGSVEGDKIFRLVLMMRLTADVITNDPHEEMLNLVAAVEDFFDGLLANEDDIVEGADGFDDRRWTFEYAGATAGAQVGRATCRQTCIVKIEREAN